MLNCTTGMIDDSHFHKWTPLIGIYIATATLVYAIAIIGDLLKGLCSKQYWIPSRYTSLNSIALFILGAATKLSMDLSTTMPRHIDQLAKLGTSAFMCIALASMQPSLGKLESRELQSNTVALSILVISSIVSLCIQLRSGVIYTFKTAHIIMLTMMSFLLIHCVATALVLSYYNSLYQTNYQVQDWSARRECIDVEHDKHLRTKKLKEYLKRFSMLAHSGCPHYLLGRSPESTLPTIWGLVSAIAFFVNQITFVTHGDKILASTSGSGISAYNWSVLWIFMTQTIALGVATILLCIRGCYLAMICLKGEDSPPWKVNAVKIEFWMKIDWLTVLLHHFFHFIDYSQQKSLVYKLMIPYPFIRLFFNKIIADTSEILLNIVKFCYRHILYIPFFPMSRYVTCKLPCSPSPTTRPDDLASEEDKLSGQYLCPPPLEEKEGSVRWIMKSIIYDTQKYMSAKERKTQHLEELLTQYLSPDFRGVVRFDSGEVAPLDPQGSPPNCWSLPVVTLTSIALALPNVDHHSIVKLIKGVNEGLVFAKLIEDKFNNQPHLYTIRCAAYRLWGGGFGPWFRNRVKPAFQNKRPIETLESIATSAAHDFNKYADKYAMRQVAAHSKYRLCKTILLEYRNETQHDEASVLEEHRNENIAWTQDDRVYPSCERIFEKLCVTIADILGACLSNLRRYILMECSNSSSIEERREAASRILKFFGDTEKIMEIVEAREIPDISLEKMVSIDEWREYYLQRQRQLP